MSLNRLFPILKQAVDQDQNDPDGNRRVRDIEGRPVITREVKVEEVEDRAEAHPVDDVADRPAEHQADRAGEKAVLDPAQPDQQRSEEHTSELQSLMRISYAVFCLKKKHKQKTNT